MSKTLDEKITELERDFTKLSTFAFKAKHGTDFHGGLKMLVIGARREQIESDYRCYETNLPTIDADELKDIRSHQLRELEAES